MSVRDFQLPRKWWKSRETWLPAQCCHFSSPPPHYGKIDKLIIRRRAIFPQGKHGNLLCSMQTERERKDYQSSEEQLNFPQLVGNPQRSVQQKKELGNIISHKHWNTSDYSITLRKNTTRILQPPDSLPYYSEARVCLADKKRHVHKASVAHWLFPNGSRVLKNYVHRPGRFLKPLNLTPILSPRCWLDEGRQSYKFHTGVLIGLLH